MSTFHQLANELLKLEDHVFFDSPKNGSFGFEYKSDYSGLMAQPPKVGPSKGKVKRAKQGFLDIVITTGTRFKKVTHREIFEDLMNNSDEEYCLRAWRGEDPRIIGRTDDEKEALTAMILLMFEQEVNWGNEVWQRGSNFSPLKTKPSKRRPRDMMLGFIRQSFHLGHKRLDELKYWMRSRPGTVWFTDRPESPWGYSSYPKEQKRFFTELEEMDGTEAVMLGDTVEKFRELVVKYPDNPFFGEK